MARYIDAEKLINKMFPIGLVDNGNYTINAKTVKVAIDQTPTADVSPKSEVAREIFEGVDSLLDLVCHMIGIEILSFPQYTELKKKYTEDPAEDRRKCLSEQGGCRGGGGKKWKEVERNELL